MPPDPTRLARAAERKRHDTLERAAAALAALDERGETISFQAVARAAGVSRQWLYQQPELRAEIEKLRASSARQTSAVPSRERATEASLRQRIETLIAENRRLRGELAELRAELAIAYGTQRAASG
jgi:hypothetical protein